VEVQMNALLAAKDAMAMHIRVVYCPMMVVLNGLQKQTAKQKKSASMGNATLNRVK